MQGLRGFYLSGCHLSGDGYQKWLHSTRFATKRSGDVALRRGLFVQVWRGAMAAPPRKALLEVMPHLAELSFPLDEARLLEIVTAIKEVPGLPSVPRQELPRLPPSMSLVDRHKRVQQFIEAFEYNFTGENFFNVRGVRQNQSLFRVLELAKRVIREALPIKSASRSHDRVHNRFCGHALCFREEATWLALTGVRWLQFRA